MWILHQDIALAHTALLFESFLAKLEHPPYALDQALCDFSVFSKWKETLKGYRVDTVEAMKKKRTEMLSENDFIVLNRMERCIEKKYKVKVVKKKKDVTKTISFFFLVITIRFMM